MGDISVARCPLPNCKPVVNITVYISVNQNVTDIIDYILETLLAYTEGGSKLLGKQYHVLPLILAGDFSIDFDEDEGLRVIQLKSELNLDFDTGRALGRLDIRCFHDS
ncbi:uncharacterized protein TNCV_2186701 [Trichonephila clavipes]|nr:uncharacterized protein TNCV_2186701 [Trichonephila clavipes]